MRYKLGSTIYIYLPENQSVQKMHAPELNEINNSFCQFAATTNSYTYVDSRYILLPMVENFKVSIAYNKVHSLSKDGSMTCSHTDVSK